MGVPRGTLWKRNLQKTLQDTVREGGGVGNVELKSKRGEFQGWMKGY